jgi:hypothetical protein
MQKKHSLIMAILVIGSLFMAACQPETVVEQVEVTKVIEKEVVVTEVVEIEGEEVEVTRVVTEEVIVEVTPTPEPLPQGGVLC